ncbi:hypothetical protein OEB99_10160 [Actinotalea sp. M2MS4P-6]|nr:hypothetical protein [Actinotalea sp. M2MS4P-6]MCV2394671.1 hypothetical protein [Actinotalea sp. M2MS4P-6]
MPNIHGDEYTRDLAPEVKPGLSGPRPDAVIEGLAGSTTRPGRPIVANS